MEDSWTTQLRALNRLERFGCQYVSGCQSLMGRSFTLAIFNRYMFPTTQPDSFNVHDQPDRDNGDPESGSHSELFQTMLKPSNQVLN
jgi:hypothetical protein